MNANRALTILFFLLSPIIVIREIIFSSSFIGFNHDWDFRAHERLELKASLREIVKVLSERWEKTERPMYYDAETRGT